MVICLERGADLHTAQLMPLPLTASCSSKIQTGFTFLVPAHTGSPGQAAVKRMCVCVRLPIDDSTPVPITSHSRHYDKFSQRLTHMHTLRHNDNLQHAHLLLRRPHMTAIEYLAAYIARSPLSGLPSTEYHEVVE